MVELGLAGPQDEVEAEPLTGGVASDIARVRIGEQSYCVKFALSKLKVEADWFAPVHRNAAEYAWLEIASKIAPESAVKLFGRSDTEHGFAMEFLEGALGSSSACRMHSSTEIRSPPGTVIKFDPGKLRVPALPKLCEWYV